MFTRLLSRIKPPVFADEEHDRIAHTLFVIQLTMLIAALVVLVLAVIGGEASTVLGLLLGVVFTAGALWLNQRGHVRASSIGTILIWLSLATFFLLMGPGVHSIAITLYPTIVIIASLLLDRRAFLAVTAALLFSLGFSIFAEMMGWLRPFPLGTTGWTDFAALAVVLIFTAITMRFLVDNLIQSLQRARRNEQALADSHGQLQQQAEALRRAEEDYRTLVENAVVGFFRSTPDNRFISVNPAMARMYGYDSPADMLASVTDIKHQIYADPTVRATMLQQLEAEGRIVDYETHDQRKDGSTFWTSMNVRVVRDEHGAVLWYEGTLQDVTARKQAEAARRKGDAILATVAQVARTLLESADWRPHIASTLAMLGTTSGATHVYVFENHLGANGELLTSQRYEWVRPGFQAEIDDPRLQAVPVYQPELDDWYEPLMRGEAYYGPTRSFSEHWSENLSRRGIKTLLDVPIFVGGRWWGIIGFDDCVNELAWSQVEVDALRTAAEILGAAIQRQQADDEREKLIADLEAKNAELERFTYTVSHDLKAPLITVRGFLGFVEEDARAGNWERLASDMERIVEATDRMRRLLDELLELSRIGRLMNPSETMSFAAIAEEAIALVRGSLEAENVQIEIQPDLPVVQGDRARLVEVMQNLIDNACSFMGDRSEPRITIGQRGTDWDGKPIVFVRDNGIGIDPQYHEKVFGLFDKLDPRSPGTGIGLALVKRIVEVHGGRIWVESAGAGCGSTFCFTLPSGTADELPAGR